MEGELEVIERTKKTCLGCGRSSSPMRTLEAVSGRKKYVITAPWCPTTKIGGCGGIGCALLTEEEKKDPGIIDFHTSLPPDDFIDFGILELVVECRSRGWLTMWSCDGHGRNGYITFMREKDASEAMGFFKEKWPAHSDLFYIRSLPHTSLGQSFRVFIPAACLKGTERKRHHDSRA